MPHERCRWRGENVHGSEVNYVHGAWCPAADLTGNIHCRCHRECWPLAHAGGLMVHAWQWSWSHGGACTRTTAQDGPSKAHRLCLHAGPTSAPSLNRRLPALRCVDNVSLFSRCEGWRAFTPPRRSPCRSAAAGCCGTAPGVPRPCPPPRAPLLCLMCTSRSNNHWVGITLCFCLSPFSTSPPSR